MKAVRMMIDESLEKEIERFRSGYKQGVVPIEFLMPFLVKLGMYYCSLGGRLPDIKLGEEGEDK